MATREEIVRLIYEADNKKLIKALKEQHNLDDKATKQLSKELKKRETAATRVAKKIAKAQERASEAGKRATRQATKDKIESFKKFGEAAQGSIGATTGRVFALGEGITKFASAAGPVGIAALAIAALATAGVIAFAAIAGGVVAAGAAVVKFMDKAEQLREELEPLYDLGALEVISPEQAASISAFNQDMDGLGSIMKNLAVQVAGNLAPQLEKISHLVLTVGFLVSDMAQNWINSGSLINRAITYQLMRPLMYFVETFESFMFVNSRAFASLGKALGVDLPAASDKFWKKANSNFDKLEKAVSGKVQEGLGALENKVNGMGGAFGEAQAKAFAMRASLSLVASGAHDASEKIEKTKDKTGDLAKQMTAFHKRVEAISKGAATMMSQFAAFGERARLSMATPVQAIQLQLVKDLDAFEEVRNKLAEQAHKLDTAIASKEAMGLETGLLEAQLEQALSQLQKFEADRVAITQAASEKIADIRDQEAQKLTDAYFSTSGAIIGATHSLAAFADAQAKQAKDGTEAQKKAARTAFAISQSAGVAQITISTAQAVMQALASLPVPFGAIAAGAAAATGAAQLATVLSAPAPSFHAGGAIGNASMAPDEVNIRAKSGEGVLSSRGMDAIGGRDGLRAANRGQGRSEEIVVVQKYQHRSFSAFAEDNVRMTNSPIRKAIKRRRKVGHR
jgi:hypothetical protein